MEIEDIYHLLPEFQCRPGCIECCTRFGVPSMTAVERTRLDRFLESHGMKRGEAQGTTCPYVGERGCAVYPVRPLTCRLYGTSPDCLCFLGARPLHLLHEDEEAEIFHLYRMHFVEQE